MEMIMTGENESKAFQPSAPPPETAKKGISREDVVLAFKLILGRPPENEKVIVSHQVGSLEELRTVLLKSAEFADKYKAIQKPISQS